MLFAKIIIHGDDYMIILKFINKYFDIRVFILFLITSLILIFIDARGYKKLNMAKEEKFSRVMGYIYVVLAVVLYGISKFV